MSTNPYVEEVCRIGQGARCCRYLVATPRGLACAKQSELRAVIDARVATMGAQADNCVGFPEDYEGLSAIVRPLV